MTGITNLSLSMSVVYNNDVPCCRWDITDWYNWTGVPPNGGSGKDQIATAWANGLALISDSAYGVYTSGGGNISNNRNDMTPNLGVDWEFAECTYACYQYADWGYLAAGIHETSRHWEATNVVFKYFHTYQSLEYSVSFSGTGPSITISPTAGQTSTTIYTSFTD